VREWERAGKNEIFSFFFLSRRKEEIPFCHIFISPLIKLKGRKITTRVLNKSLDDDDDEEEA
jgi:hypothetical protein